MTVATLDAVVAQLQGRQLARQKTIQVSLAKIARQKNRIATVCRYILLREMCRYEKNKGIYRVDSYENLPAHAVLVPGESIFETSRDRIKSYAALLQRILAVPAHGELNAGDLTQAFLNTAGICSDKPSRVFGDYGPSCNVWNWTTFQFRKLPPHWKRTWPSKVGRCQIPDPHGTLKEKRNKWHEEI